MAVLENARFRIINDRRTGSFSFFSQSQEYPFLMKNIMAVSGRLISGKKFSLEIKLCKSTIPKSHRLLKSRALQFFGKDESLKIGWKAEFMLGATQPIILWQLVISNLSEAPIFLKKIYLLKPADKKAANFKFSERENKQDLRFFPNGWQSRSYSGVCYKGERMWRSQLGFLQESMVSNLGPPTFQRKGLFSSDFFGIMGDTRSNKGIILGFLSQKQHFGTVTANLNKTPQIQIWANGDNARLQPKAAVTTDWAVYSTCNLDDPQSLSPYSEAVAEEHEICELPSPPTG
jgi:alpha-galactosidase